MQHAVAYCSAENENGGTREEEGCRRLCRQPVAREEERAGSVVPTAFAGGMGCGGIGEEDDAAAGYRRLREEERGA